MIRPTALVLSGDGINCTSETAFALDLAGFEAVTSHTSDLLENPQQLSQASLLALPGGFSFGDEIASGKVLAVKIRHKMLDILHQYIEKGGLVLGICNGFQILVQLGLLPDSNPDGEPTVSLSHNSGGKFLNRWVDMTVKQNTPFLQGLDKITLPVRHGEGRIRLKPDLEKKAVDVVRQRAALTYSEDINGSFENIAGLTNAKGNVLGLMPHPEAYIRHSQHPAFQSWRRAEKNGLSALSGDEADGLKILKNAVASVSAN